MKIDSYLVKLRRTENGAIFGLLCICRPNTILASIAWYEVYFDILDRLGVTHECESGLADFAIANAALHYVARPMKLHLYESASYK